ncbi:MAG: hypothetical protein HY983_02180 [Candidatus Magasanikbacteria bacterium]|nr:hypothetical protein [Candidatus Magasanikbacteria bacterium]
MKKTIISVIMAALLLAPLVTAFVEAKAPAPIVKQVVKTKNTKAKPVSKRLVIKPKTKKEAAPVVITAAEATDSDGAAAASVSSGAATNPTATCLRAIKKANTFCGKIARGCSSQSKTEKCVAANEQCEAEQQEALALCPAVSQ